MAHNDFSRPSGQWPAEYVPGANDFYRWDVSQSQSLDGTNGGTVTPKSPIIVGGSGIQLASAACSVTGGWTTKQGGRVRHGDGDTIQLSPSRSRTVTVPLLPTLGGLDALYQQHAYVPNLKNPGATSTQANGYLIAVLDAWLQQGATLSSVVAAFRVGVQPATVNAPTFTLSYRNLAGAFQSYLFNGQPAPANAAAYYANGQPQSLALTSTNTGSYVVDLTQYSYIALIQDNQGAASSNTYHSFAITMSGIANMNHQ